MKFVIRLLYDVLLYYLHDVFFFMSSLYYKINFLRTHMWKRKALYRYIDHKIFILRNV